MPAGSVVAYMEHRLRGSARKKKLRDKDAYVYGTLNKLGLMHGNKETAKGKRSMKEYAQHRRKH